MNRMVEALYSKKEVLVLSSAVSNVEEGYFNRNIPPGFQTDAYQELLSACQRKNNISNNLARQAKT